VSKLLKCLLKGPGQIQCAKVQQCFSSNQGFLTHLLGGQLFILFKLSMPPSYSLIFFLWFPWNE